VTSSRARSRAGATARSAAKSAWLACAALLVAGCAARTQTTTKDFDPQGNPGESYTVQSTFISKDRAALDRARELARAGDYGGAIQVLDGLYAKRDLDPKMRQEVLLGLGEMHGAALNLARDYGKATAYLQELLAIYPKTEYRQRAEELLAEYAKHQE